MPEKIEKNEAKESVDQASKRVQKMAVRRSLETPQDKMNRSIKKKEKNRFDRKRRGQGERDETCAEGLWQEEPWRLVFQETLGCGFCGQVVIG